MLSYFLFVRYANGSPNDKNILDSIGLNWIWLSIMISTVYSEHFKDLQMSVYCIDIRRFSVADSSEMASKT